MSKPNAVAVATDVVPWVPRLRCVRGLLALAVLCLGLGEAAAQDKAWPSRPITLVVGFSKNSTSEMVASALAGPLARRLGQPVTVLEELGRSGTAAAAKVASATDHHTVAILVNNAMTVADLLDDKLPYRPSRDLRPLAFLSEDSMVLTATAASGPTEPRAWLETARHAPQPLRYGSQGVGSIGHLAMEYLSVKASFHPQHQPYAGGPEILKALLAAQVDMAVLPVTLAKRATSQGGTVRVVALTSRHRSAQLPDVPSLHELGVLGFDYRVWTVAAVPSSLPQAHADKLAASLAAAISEPETVKRLAAVGVTVPADVSTRRAKVEIEQETRLLGGIAMMRNIKVAPGGG